MKHHILLSNIEDISNWEKNSDAGYCPRDYIILLKKQLNAYVHMPNIPTTSQDKLLALLDGRPENWALARDLVNKLDRNDVVFCDCDGSGISLAALFANQPNRPRIVSFFHNFTRPKSLVSTKFLRVSRAIDVFLVCSAYQSDFLRRYLNLPVSRVQYVPYRVDLNFFTPGSQSQSQSKTKPIIASVGLENRNYRLLADAAKDLDVEVKISSSSSYAKQLKRAFPNVFPDNMSRRYYKWNELVQLYRDADIVVVSVYDSAQAAGGTSLLEAMACKRPIIATKTKGLASYLDSDSIITVEPGDVLGLKQAIEYLLKNPDEARERAERAYQIALKQHSIEKFTSKIVEYMNSIN